MYLGVLLLSLLVYFKSTYFKPAWVHFECLGVFVGVLISSTLQYRNISYADSIDTAWLLPRKPYNKSTGASAELCFLLRLRFVFDYQKSLLLVVFFLFS